MLSGELWREGAEEGEEKEEDAGGHGETELQEPVPESAASDPFQLPPRGLAPDPEVCKGQEAGEL